MLGRNARRQQGIRPRIPNYGYTDHQLWLSLPLRPAVADLSAVPDALVDKLISHGNEPVNGAVDIKGILSRSASREESTALAAKVAAAVALIAGLLWLIRDSPSALFGTVLGAHVAVVWLVCGAIASYLWLQSRREFSYSEVATLKQAEIVWPLDPSELAKYPNAEVLRREWADADPRPSGCGSAALVWREPRLVAVANAIAKDIRANPVWGTGFFDTAHLDGQIDEVLRDVTARSYRLWRSHAESEPALHGLGAPDVDETVAEAAWAVGARQVDQLAEWGHCVTELNLLFDRYLQLVETTSASDDYRACLQQALDRDAEWGDVDFVSVGIPSGETTGELELVQAKMTAMVAYLESAPTVNTETR